MAVSLTCLCGTLLYADDDEAGTEIDCPVCGHRTLVPAEERVPTVIPVDEPPEEEIPEMDVEEHVAAWNKKKRREQNKQKDQHEDEEEDTRTKSKPSSFANKLKAVGNAFTMVGMIRLERAAPCLAFGPAGVWGLAAEDDDVIVFNMLKGKKFGRFYEHDEAVTRIALCSDGDVALSGDEVGDIVYWVVADSRTKKRLRAHDAEITALAFSADTKYGASGDRDGAIRLWKLAAGKDRELDDSDWGEKITDVGFSPDAKLLLAAGSKGRLNVWSVDSGDRTQRFRLANQPIACARFTPKSDAIIAAVRPDKGSGDCHPTVWRLNVATGKAAECFNPTGRPSAFARQVHLDQAGKRLVIAGTSDDDGSDCIEIWSLTTAKRLHTFTELRAPVEALALTPNCMRMMVSVGRRLQVFAMPDREFAQ